ncbi:DUF47 domain-containing protein [Methanospirillum stamsii]|uniref:DUF47 domain-containing protein n=1 Tax=Methanospirillum stamsii TaxID=1277351 RepID=A0A2V2MUH0_9EURY|nr:DUF47 family protein [Methanospirillum stamsii]PWR71834.1 DUF47 domain-containing protein [Methanospirillum stamsii]
MGIKEWLIPQDKVFFDLFEQLAGTVVLAARELEQIVTNETDPAQTYKKIRELEHKGDLITHEIYEHLNRTFITPLDPMEISRLASALDDVIDYIDDSAEKLIIYKITEYDKSMQDFAQIIHLSTIQLECGVRGIRSFKNGNVLEKCGIEINRLENMADDLLAQSILRLFATEDPMTTIKLKDIYECLETATDKCEDVANVLSDISIRHS